MPKKPGGQPDNKNAFKHGFYSKYFSPFECRTLSKIPITDMSGEIGLMRVNVDRFMQAYADSLGDLDYADRLVGLRAVTLAVGRIAALQRILASAGRNLTETDHLMEVLNKIPDEELDKPFTMKDIYVEDPPPAQRQDPEK
jgi:hypothetical protein